MINLTTFARRVFLALAVVLLLAPPAAFGQHVETLIFLPREPRPGNMLQVEFSLSGAAGQAGTIELSVLTDRNGDMKFQGDEMVKNSVTFRDNDERDKEPRSRWLRLNVYQIPQDNPHQEYRVKVVVGNTSRMASLVKPGTRAVPAQIQSEGIFSALFNLPANLANKIRKAGAFLRERTVVDGVPAFAGAPSLYVYSLSDQSLQKLAHSDVRSYRSPQWSADSKALTFVVSESDVRGVAWIALDKKEEVVLTHGPDDRSPHWLSDNNHIIFIRGGKLHIVEKGTKIIKVLESPVGVSHILGVLADGSRSRIVYTASDDEAPDESAIYLLDLDKNLRPGENSRMIYSPNWFLFGWMSRDGNEILLWKDAVIYKVPRSQVEVSEDKKLIKDSNRHYDPSWSPDGRTIAFVSTLP